MSSMIALHILQCIASMDNGPEGVFCLLQAVWLPGVGRGMALPTLPI
jgi:hypothetical protein